VSNWRFISGVGVGVGVESLRHMGSFRDDLVREEERGTRRRRDGLREGRIDGRKQGRRGVSILCEREIRRREKGGREEKQYLHLEHHAEMKTGDCLQK